MTWRWEWGRTVGGYKWWWVSSGDISGDGVRRYQWWRWHGGWQGVLETSVEIELEDIRLALHLLSSRISVKMTWRQGISWVGRHKWRWYSDLIYPLALFLTSYITIKLKYYVQKNIKLILDYRLYQCSVAIVPSYFPSLVIFWLISFSTIKARD